VHRFILDHTILVCALVECAVFVSVEAANKSSQCTFCYTKPTVSSLALTKTITVHVASTDGWIARLCRPE